jgi:tetratricopeptide (TPR) repeat protein
MSLGRGHGLTGMLCGLCSVLIIATGLAALDSERIADLEQRVRCVGRVELIRGERLEREGQWERAKLAYRRALRCQPGYTRAQIALGRGMLEHERNVDKAVTWFERAVRSDPGSVIALNNLAAAYLRTDRPQEAIEVLDRAREIDPRQTQMLYNRARALDELGRGGQAIAAWREFIRAARGHPDHREDLRFARRRVRELSQETSE